VSGSPPTSAADGDGVEDVSVDLVVDLVVDDDLAGEPQAARVSTATIPTSAARLLCISRT
jgi:hypothetical protein